MYKLLSAKLLLLETSLWNAHLTRNKTHLSLLTWMHKRKLIFSITWIYFSEEGLGAKFAPWLIIFATETQSTKQKCSVATNVVLLSFRVALCTHNFSIKQSTYTHYLSTIEENTPYFFTWSPVWERGRPFCDHTNLLGQSTHTSIAERFCSVCRNLWVAVETADTRSRSFWRKKEAALSFFFFCFFSRTDHGHVHLSINFCSSTVARLVHLLQRQR